MSSETIAINKNKLIASTVSIVVFTLLLILLLFYSILSPNTDVEKETRSIEIAEFNVSETTNQIKGEASIKENPQFNNISNTTPSLKNSSSASQKTNAELLTQQFIASKAKNTTITTGENENNSTVNSAKTIGNTEIKNDAAIVNDNIGINLTGRKVIINPTISKETKEQGKVVVEIIVDNNGTVIKADPNGRGTTTSNPALKQKAKQAAMSTKFNSSLIEEQKGTITIIFSF